MNTKLFLTCTGLILITTSTISLSQEKFSFGLKGGIGLWRFINLEGSPGFPRDYSFSLGFSLGVYTESKLSENFSILSELNYQNSSLTVTISTGIEGILEQKINSQLINLPILLKFRSSWMDIFFFAGPSFAYLLKASYSYKDEIYENYYGTIEITKNLPSISSSIELGLGKKFDISSNNILIEFRAQIGLTKFQYKDVSGYYDIGKWNNGGLILQIGYEIL